MGSMAWIYRQVGVHAPVEVALQGAVLDPSFAARQFLLESQPAPSQLAASRILQADKKRRSAEKKQRQQVLEERAHAEEATRTALTADEGTWEEPNFEFNLPAAVVAPQQLARGAAVASAFATLPHVAPGGVAASRASDATAAPQVIGHAAASIVIAPPATAVSQGLARAAAVDVDGDADLALVPTSVSTSVVHKQGSIMAGTC